ncbi:MAG: HD domain-containing protein [Acidobacteriota bacterium]
MIKNTDRKFIKDLIVGEQVESYFRIISFTKRLKRDGNPFLTLTFMDKTGQIGGKIWESIEQIMNILEEGKIFRINGSINEYQGTKEIKVDSIGLATPDGDLIKESDFIEEAPFDTEKMFSDMIVFMRSRISSEYILQLIESFKSKYKEKFCSHYGAQKIHHAYTGGLLRHTFSVIKVADLLADFYELDKDILLTGAFFHDIGKMEEFTVFPSISLTEEGGLEGHIVIGLRIFSKLTSEIKGFPESEAKKIRHAIISHHGEKDFGSPEVPKTREAFVLHIVDLLDSKLDIINNAIKNSEKRSDFTDYIPLLGRRLYNE